MCTFTTLFLHVSVYHTLSSGRTHVHLTDDGVWYTETFSRNIVNINVMNIAHLVCVIREVFVNMRTHGMEYLKIVKPVGARNEDHALEVKMTLHDQYRNVYQHVQVCALPLQEA